VHHDVYKLWRAVATTTERDFLGRTDKRSGKLTVRSRVERESVDFTNENGYNGPRDNKILIRIVMDGVSGLSKHYTIVAHYGHFPAFRSPILPLHTLTVIRNNLKCDKRRVLWW